MNNNVDTAKEAAMKEFLFHTVVGATIGIVSPYFLWNWQFWIAWFIIAGAGEYYARTYR